MEAIMKDSQNTILITGGSAGIGLALAARFLRNGNEVIICGRRREKLEKSKNQYPRLHIYQCDVSLEQDRRALFEKVTRDFPKLNVLINNAGIASPLQLDLPAQWKETQKLIETNFQAPIHLTQLFAKHLSAQDNPVVMITTSGLAHAPRAQFPVYSATKAALHSITLSMRHQFKSINIEVIEICPPACRYGPWRTGT